MRLSLLGDKDSLVAMDPDVILDSFDEGDDLRYENTINDYTYDNNSYPEYNGSSGGEPLGCMEGSVQAYDSVLFGTTLAVPEWEALLTAFVLTLIILMTLVGNVLVILSVFTYKPLRIVQNFFIVSLAVADLTVALLVLPFNVAYSLIGRWEFGITLCKIWLTCDVLCCTASILHLCAIALDRYWAITDPLAYAQKRTLRRVMLMIAGVWLASGAISSPPLAGWNDWPEEFTNNTACRLTQQPGYIVYSSLGSFYIPLFVMTIVYAEIFVAARRRLRERAKASKLNAVKQSVVSPAPGANAPAQGNADGARPIEVGRRERSSDSIRGATHDGESVSSETNHNDVEAQPLSASTGGGGGSGKKKRRKGSGKVKGGIGKKWRRGSKAAQNNAEAKEQSVRDNSVTDVCGENGVSAADGVEGHDGPLAASAVAAEEKRAEKAAEKAVSSSPSAPLVKKPAGSSAPVYQFIEERQRISLSKERRAARTLGVIMGSFVVCWLPFFLMYVILPFCKSCCPPEKLVNFITWLGYINSALNPIIYTIFNLDFRRAFKKLLHMKP
ncbi:putative tyramine receptor 2 [Ischnura elegans]|uniref:putative tyramine receptor 2 n=1 Tax=Ischnura elegans TaxID=197161 RepID=UPI001ED89087|nr:putative tyramine receptor 2 [Ischnura elegans]